MWFIKRSLEKDIRNSLFWGKIIIIYGPRQVGKTTLVQHILKDHQDTGIYFNCDEPDIREIFSEKTSTEMKQYIWNKKLIIIDEAQRVKNIWVSLKILHDTYPDIQIIATGSSSFELANQINEPLTWRKKEFFMYPISFQELSQDISMIELDRSLEKRIIYGMYPEIIYSDVSEQITNLKSLTESYVFKDILNFWKIKKSDFLIKLLQALALQIGSEISYNELSRLLWIDKKTVEKYIDILEKAFIVFRLSSLNRNVRSELKKSKKIYFYDTWLRNALINNFNVFSLRNDVWDLFENFLIVERMKFNNRNHLYKNTFFWRTTTQKEIDFIEEYQGKIYGYEFKYNSDSYKKHKEFIEKYENASIELINKKNYKSFILDVD